MAQKQQQEIEEFPIEEFDEEPEDVEVPAKGIWETITTPIPAISSFADSVANYIDPIQGNKITGERNPIAAFGAGVIRGMIPDSPLDIGLTAGGGTIAKYGGRALTKVPGVVRALETPLWGTKKTGKVTSEVLEALEGEVINPPKREPLRLGSGTRFEAGPPVQVREKGGRFGRGKTTNTIDLSVNPRPPYIDPKAQLSVEMLPETRGIRQSRGNPELAGSTPYTANQSVEAHIADMLEDARLRLGKKVSPKGVVNDIDPVTLRSKNAPVETPRESLFTGTQGAVDVSKMVEPAQKMGLADWANLPRALITTPDLSAPFRQGFGIINRKAWWTSWDDMVKAAGSQRAYDDIISEISARPNFKPRPKLDDKGAVILDTRTGLPKMKESFAEEVGLKLTDVAGLGKREENFVGSQLLEAIPGYGKLVRGSNRGYVAFLNKARADVFDSLMDSATKMGRNPHNDLRLAQQLASYVNNATGRGDLGKLEKSAEALNAVLFSPRLIASRLQMLNPKNYLSKSIDPMVRKEYWKSFFGMAMAGNTMLGLAKAGGADVSLNPTSSDFGKIKFGNTRLDPWGGFQQYGVAAARFLSGQITSSSDPNAKPRALGSTPFTPTRIGLMVNTNNTQQSGRGFLGNKVNPLVGFVWDWMSASPNKPFDLPRAAMEGLVPIIAQDILDVIQDDPSLAQIISIPLAGVGMGTQTYGARQ